MARPRRIRALGTAGSLWTALAGVIPARRAARTFLTEQTADE